MDAAQVFSVVVKLSCVAAILFKPTGFILSHIFEYSRPIRAFISYDRVQYQPT